ncbi:hypothetical protein SLS54_009426 [Diplodia seriata]
MHRPLLIASLAGSALGGTLPFNVPPDNPTETITTTVACDDECDTIAIATTTYTADTTAAVQTSYVTTTRSLADENSDASSASLVTSQDTELSGTFSASASSAQVTISQGSTSVPDTSSWPTMQPAVPGNQPLNGLDSLAPSNSSKLTFTLDGNSDPSTEHHFAEMTANHTTPAVVLEHSQLVTDISCTAQGLQVDLSTAAALEYVRSAWDTNFIAITSSVDCGSAPSGHHSYWNVTAATYPGAMLTMRLDAVEIAIEDALDEVHLIWGTHVPTNTTGAPPPPSSTDDDTGGYLDFNEDFASALQHFAPGLSTYQEEDYEGDDSPANATVGDPDFEIEDNGILPRQQPQPARKGYAQPEPARKSYPQPEPARKSQDRPPAPARKGDDPAYTEQRVQSTKKQAQVQEKAYQDTEAVLEKARKSAAAARGDYFIARQEAKASPGNKVLAQKATTAKAKLATENKKVVQARSIAQAQSKAAKAAKNKAAAAQSVKDAAGTKGLPTDKGAKADPLAVAKRVAKDTKARLEADPKLRADFQSRAAGFVSFLGETYSQLTKVVQETVSKLSSNVGLDLPLPIHVSLASWRKNKVVDDTPWGPQYHISDGEAQNEAESAGGSFSLYCVDCAFTADIHISGEVSFSVLERKLKKGSITVEGSDIAASLFLGLEAYAWAQWEDREPVLDAAIPPGFTIPRIITLGPAVRYETRVAMLLEAEGFLMAGADVNFSDFTASFDLLDSSKADFSGFKPTFTPQFEAYGSIRAGVQIGYPLSIAITMHIPLAKYDTGIAITSEPYVKGVASYGEVKNCTKGIDYRIRGGLDVYANIFKIVKTTLRQYIADPPIATGCKPIPSAIAKYLPAGTVEKFDEDDEDDGDDEVDNTDSVIDEAENALDGTGDDDLSYQPVTAGGGEWLLTADDDGTLSLIPAESAADANLAQRLFAYIDGAVTADSNQRLLVFFIDPSMPQLSRLEVVDEDYIVADHEAATLIAVEADQETDTAVLVPADTQGDSYIPVACVIVDGEYESNNLFVVTDADEGIEMLKSGKSAVTKLAGGTVQDCIQIAFDAPMGGI